MSRVLLALPLLAAPLAGCLGQPPEGPDLAAPVWSPGQTWNYTLYEAEGPTPAGWVQWTVTGREPVENQSDQAYRTRELTHRFYDHDHDGEANQTERDRLNLDADTLNRVWNVCREVQGRGYFGACQGTQRTWDFPLTDGKRWSSRSHGDVIVRYEHTAQHHASFTIGNRTFEDVWVLERTREDSNRSRRVDVFDPDIDAFRYRALLRTDTQPAGQEPRVQWAWVLAEHQAGGAP